MLDLIKANLSSIIVGAIVLLIVGAVVIKLIRDKKNHKSSCGACCSGCAMAKDCHK
ncbi:MAG TPA: FeoB-associated Cys-rich membrane protein [Clostridiaceae bacterium]|nr:FeoB-associated Cys-rich membrane protein [Clostridiaceae bacterium]